VAGHISTDAAHSLKWKRYPFVLAEGAAELVFPQAGEGIKERSPTPITQPVSCADAPLGTDGRFS
jgi:hypothetical protein